MEERQEVLEKVKKKARQKYLDMREEQQLEIFLRRIEAERKMFEGVVLTKEEMKINKLNEEIF